jgi:hypothetical protein
VKIVNLKGEAESRIVVVFVFSCRWTLVTRKKARPAVVRSTSPPRCTKGTVTSTVVAWSRNPQQVADKVSKYHASMSVVPNIATVGHLLPRDPVMRLNEVYPRQAMMIQDPGPPQHFTRVFNCRCYQPLFSLSPSDSDHMIPLDLCTCF